MTSGLRPYPAYKDSGVPWLGQVPAHWDVLRAKYLFREVDERSATGSEELLSVSHKTGITPRSQKSVTMFMAESYAGHKLCRPGDVVVNTMWAWMGALGVSQHQGIVSPSYAVYRPRPQATVLPTYADQLLRTQPYVSEYVRRSTGVQDSRLRLYPEQFLDVPVLRPPADDQQAIVVYIAALSRLVGRYIRSKQRLIALLNEQKRAIIHHAVTRGLDPSIRLKPSGIEGFGDIPEHWHVIALKRVLRALIDCEHKTAPAVSSSEYHVVRTSAVRGGRLRWEGTYCTTASAFAEWTRRGKPEPGDVIFTREAPAGEACVVPAERSVCLGQRTVLMKPDRDQYDPRFLVQMVHAGPAQDRIRLVSQGSTVAHFNIEDIGALPVLRPPLTEQQTILEVLRRRTHGLDVAVDRSIEEVGLLREYRTRLIADVVTGKVDVRQAAARLPQDQVGQPEALKAERMPDDDDEAAGAEAESEVELAEGSE